MQPATLALTAGQGIPAAVMSQVIVMWPDPKRLFTKRFQKFCAKWRAEVSGTKLILWRITSCHYVYDVHISCRLDGWSVQTTDSIKWLNSKAGQTQSRQPVETFFFPESA